MEPGDKNRYRELDGLRAVAIFAVIGFHYFSWYPSLYPYGDAYAQFWRYGFLGVELFFIISGFVIHISLVERPGFVDFAIRRFSRLWPPMLVCSLLTFSVMSLVQNSYTEFINVRPVDFIPSLTFTTPHIWRWLDPEIGYVDGPYWSLFVEVRFYFIVAVMLSVLKSRTAVFFFGLSIIANLLNLAFEIAETTSAQTFVILLLFPKYIHLFGAGLVFSEMMISGFRRWHVLALIFYSLVNLLYFNVAASLIIMSFYLIFLIFLYRRNWLKILTSRGVVLIGLASYSIYLLHMNIGVAFIVNDPDGGVERAIVAYLISITMGIAVYFLVERRSKKISRFLTRLIPGDASAIKK